MYVRPKSKGVPKLKRFEFRVGIIIIINFQARYDNFWSGFSQFRLQSVQARRETGSGKFSPGGLRFGQSRSVSGPISSLPLPLRMVRGVRSTGRP